MQHLSTLVLIGLMTALPPPDAWAQPFEVWLVDQSNSFGRSYGGRIHIYDGTSLMGEAASEARTIAEIDLGAETAALCAGGTGANPVRPHMLFFDATHRFAVLSFVASGHVAVFDASARRPVACLRMTPGAGGAIQAHAAFPSPDNRYILVANQNGKLLQRIDTDYEARQFTLNHAATLDLAACTTPNGVACQATGVRPDNAPVCPVLDRTGARAFVTLRGGGLLVVDPRTTPMTIVGEYDAHTVHGNGCGGALAASGIFIDSGGGTASNLAEFEVYRFPLEGYSAANPVNAPQPDLVFTDPAEGRDAHGMALTRSGRQLWVADRHSGRVEVFDTVTSQWVGTIDAHDGPLDDPAPDLMDVAPAGNRVFISRRGPNPLSGDPHVATGATPGLLVVTVENDGGTGRVVDTVRISNLDAAGVERADAHGIRVRHK